ncbi:MAG: hypothetical protein PUP46_11155 [Endozoicomonas sp. (ex Botrylloides leachii)]|nr:hypothetical protein [Endozoicomonas sp. (ex Botrylloides leachii)]
MINSLALSDAVLAFVSAFSVFLMAQRNAIAQVHRLSSIMALLGFFLITLAASLGALRYGVSPLWVKPHDLMTGIATFISPPILSAALCLGLSTKAWSYLYWAIVLAVFYLLYMLADKYHLEELWRNTLLSLSLIGCLLFTLRSQLNYGVKLMLLIAIISYFLGGLVLGFHGMLLGYLRLELFRYFIGLGNLLLSASMYLTFKRDYSL